MRDFNEFVGYQKWKEDHQLRSQWKEHGCPGYKKYASYQVGDQQNQERL